MVTRLQRLSDLGDEHTDYSLPEAPLLVPPRDAMESLQIGLWAKEQIVALRQQECQWLHSWREWLDDASSTDHGAVRHWLRGDDPTPPVVFLPREDWTATTHIPEMDTLLQRAWGPINRHYANRPQLDVDLLGTLTRGCTALVPKEGPPGALNTCPQTQLSLVYRLWAWLRLQEGMAW